MDELEISGKRYISSRRAGKEHKYHPDYIGQLVRAGKVQGQKVGRAWYVEADSLTDYLSREKIPDLKPAQEAIQTPAFEKVIEPIVPAPIQRVESKVEMEKKEIPLSTPHVESTATHITEDPMSHKIPVTKISDRTYGGLQYVADNSPFFPPIQRIPITTAPFHKMESERVQIIEKKNVSPARWRKLVVQISVLLIVGGVSLGVAALISVRLNATLVIENGEPASIQYSLQ